MFGRAFILMLSVAICCAQAQVVVNPGAGRRPMMRRGGVRGGGRIHTNVHQGPDSLHRPWAGSDTYEKNLRRSNDNGRSDFQRDRDATLDVYHREEDRARRIAQEEAARAEQQQQVRDNKAVIEANARAEAAERRAREAERVAEIRARAAEQEQSVRRRQEEDAKVHDAILRALPDCAAKMPDGSPCRMKANPGSHYCARHLREEQ